MGEESTLPVIISSSLNDEQKGKLLDVLKEHKGALGWTIADITGINPVDCMHYIHLDENTKPTRKMQRRLNLNMKEVVRTEVLKLLDAGATFQRCMLSIFSDIFERFLEVFIDEFSVFSDSFDQCLHHLTLIL